MPRLSNLMTTIVTANLDYFYRCDYEDYQMRDRILKWLDGKEDEGAKQKVIDWMHRDAKWLVDIRWVTVRRAWIIAPLIWLLMWHIRDRMLWWVKRLEKGEL